VLGEHQLDLVVEILKCFFRKSFDCRYVGGVSRGS